MTELNINKTHWKKVKFGDIVIEPKESTKDLVADGFEHIVGLEHIDSGDIHLRKSETEDLETSFTKIFRKGDVLFGRRRAYLKKAALAEFDGICSGDITVFRVKKDLIPELLPFIVHNEKFFDFAVKHSAGGLSPRVKFKDLANYEFLLPPLDQQKQLAKLLWAMDEVIEKEKEVRAKVEVFQEGKMLNLLNGQNLVEDYKELPKDWKLKSIQELGTISTSSVNKKSEPNQKTINLINYMDVYSNDEKVIDNNINFMQVTATEHQLNSNQVNKGDVLFTPSSETVEDIGHSAVVYEDLKNSLFSYHLVRLKFDKEIEVDLNFKRFLFNNPRVLYEFSRRAKGATRFTLSLEDFNKIKVKIPPLEIQKKIAKKLSDIIENKRLLDSKIHSSEQLLRSLIHQIF